MSDKDTIEDAETTDVITIPNKADVPAIFENKKIEQLVESIEKQVRSTVIDHTTPVGRKAIKSLAMKVSRSKTLIDEVGREQNEERNKLNKEVNEMRNLAKERLDALRDEVRAPVEEWEAAEAARVRVHMINMDAFDLERTTSAASSSDIQGIIDAITAVEVNDTWEEYQDDATAAKAAALVKYDGDLGVAKAREAQEAELEALRAEKAEREQAEAARIAAEQEKAAEQERADEAAKREQAAIEQAQAQAKADAEAAEARHKEELAEAAKREERAAQAERDRIAAEQKAEEDAANARAADKKHRQKIRSEVVASITAAAPANWEELVDQMIVGEIAHVKVIV